MSDHLSACLAIRGKISLTWIPATLVWIGRKGPRTSAGALGFGSQVSICEGPPTRNNMIQLTSLSGAAPAAFRAARAGRVSPRPATAPAWRKSRRVRPSQKETERGASSRNIGNAPSMHHTRATRRVGPHDRTYPRAGRGSTEKPPGERPGLGERPGWASGRVDPGRRPGRTPSGRPVSVGRPASVAVAAVSRRGARRRGRGGGRLRQGDQLLLGLQPPEPPQQVLQLGDELLLGHALVAVEQFEHALIHLIAVGRGVPA